MSSQKPVIVVSHGAWHVPAHYEPTAKPLREAGYEVIIPKQKSIGGDSDSGKALYEDAAQLAGILREQLSSGKDVILVMHSYGGIAGSEAVGMVYDGKGVEEFKGRIRRLVFLAAHVIPKGVAFLEPGRQLGAIHVPENGMSVHTTPYERYYWEISREDAEPALALLEPMARSAFQSETSYAGWKDYGIPCTYIKCLKDVAVPPEMCDGYVARMKDAGVEVDLVEIDAGHCCHFTTPSLVVGALEKALE